MFKIAKFEKDGLSIEIKDVVQVNASGVSGLYEDFTLVVLNQGKEVVKGMNGVQYLCGGNIKGLMSIMREVLDGKTNLIDFTFTEPDYSFIVKKYDEYYNETLEEFIDEGFEITMWINSGKWEGIYSNTEIGLKMVFYRDEFEAIYKDLSKEWDNRSVQ